MIIIRIMGLGEKSGKKGEKKKKKKGKPTYTDLQNKNNTKMCD